MLTAEALEKLPNLGPAMPPPADLPPAADGWEQAQGPRQCTSLLVRKATDPHPARLAMAPYRRM
eukprot:CAMPEP_0115112000 /NCGR_PEP_ID=MMETSP0227-20121206/40396_1 /TAXON_ID=89957 /ORGANISM="Polarella glacialis, Strain CCMP 1383" /LENGTH=63 /DNA_ID=CAMNT_0002511517 /DNA_START=1192 /DNA_END=1383 /DNA_ORIENTATION=+